MGATNAQPMKRALPPTRPMRVQPDGKRRALVPMWPWAKLLRSPTV
jgi:hypothetical protein